MDRIDKLIAGESWKYPQDNLAAATPSGRPTLADFYARVATDNLTAQGILVVVGYPRIFAPPEQWSSWRTGCHRLLRADATMLNQVADYLDQRLRQTVDDVNTRLGKQRIIYESELDLFSGHELCNNKDQTPYLNGLSVGFGDLSWRVNRSFHPNDAGHLVVAQHIAQDLARLIEPKVDWRNTQYDTDCAGMSDRPFSIRVRNGSGEFHSPGGYSYYRVIVQATATGDLTGDGRPETAVLLWCTPQPSNFFVQEVHVYTEGTRLLAKLPPLDPLPTGLDLGPQYDEHEFAIPAPNGTLVTGVNYYSETESHASGPHVHHSLTWRWQDGRFTTEPPYPPRCEPGSRAVTVGPLCLELPARWNVFSRDSDTVSVRPCEPDEQDIFCVNGFDVYTGDAYDGLLAGTSVTSSSPFRKNADNGWMTSEGPVCYDFQFNPVEGSRLAIKGSRPFGNATAEYRQWTVTCGDGERQQVSAWILPDKKVIILTGAIIEIQYNEISPLIARANIT
jgi:hypothetical protein